MIVATPAQDSVAPEGGAQPPAGPPPHSGNPSRATLRRALDAAVARLVARAALEHWPIRADHCFLRIAYDNAVGAKWDTLVARPGWANLLLGGLAAAVALTGRIEREGRAALDPLDAASLAFRRAAR